MEQRTNLSAMSQPSQNTGSEDFATTSSSSVPTQKTFKEQLLPMIKSMQFVWFLGHLFTLIAASVYFWTYFKKGRTGKIIHHTSYTFAYASIVESFGIIVFETYKSSSVEPFRLIMDDNVQYLLIAIAFVTFLPHVAISLTPFLLFSFFHVINYLSTKLLPIMPSAGAQSYSSAMKRFIKTYNDKSMYLAAWLELATFIAILGKALLLFKGYTMTAIIYGLFLKLRYDKSVFTRTVFLKLEVQLDSLFSNAAFPPVVKQVWVKFKIGVKNVFHKASFAPSVSTATKNN